MSYIEGIGDEVTILFLSLFLVLVLCVLWVSTSVSDRPLIRVVVLDRTRIHGFLRRFRWSQLRIGLQPQAAPVTEQTDSRTDDGQPTPTTPSPPTSPAQNSGESENSSQLFDKPAENSELTDAIPQEIPQAVLDSFETELSSASTSDTVPDKSDGDVLNIKNTGSDKSAVPAVEVQPKTEDKVSSEQDTKSDSETANSENASPTPVPSDPPGGDPHAPVEASPDDLLQDGHIRIRLQYLDARQRLVQARPDDTVIQFKRKHFSVELADNFAVRFIFRGQELREDQSTLQAYHVEDNSVIHCLMSRIIQSETPTQNQPQQQQQQQQLDLGFLMFPLFALILSLIWYCRFTYRNYFSAMSTLSLIGITFMFFVAVLASFRPGIHEHND